jgi:hypothetical protein
MTKKTKIIIISIVVSILALSAIFLPLTFVVFLAKKPLTIPNAPTLILTETRLSAETNSIEGANSYIFKFITPNNNIIKIISSIPSMYIELYNSESSQYFGDFESAGVYGVSCSAVGEEESLQSHYSEITNFDRFIKLETPSVTLDTTNEQKIVWQLIRNANSYEIFITSATEETKSITITPSVMGSEMRTIASIMNSLSLPIGTYQISVVAKNSTNNYYTDSFSSTPITFTYNPI